MKINIFLLLILSSLPFCLNGQLVRAEVIATGLTCSMCSNAINKQLKTIPAVETVTTDLNTNTFVLTFKPESGATPSQVKDKVEKAGFFIGSMIIYTNRAPDTNNYKLLSNTLSKESKFKVLNKGYVTSKELKKIAKSYPAEQNNLSGNGNILYLKPL